MIVAINSIEGTCVHLEMVKTRKILFNRIWILILLCHILFISNAKPEDSAEKISQELSRAGYEVTRIEKAKIPASAENYFIVSAAKNGEEVKIKIFGDKYFLSEEHGKLLPLNIKPDASKTSKIGNRIKAVRKNDNLNHLVYKRRPIMENEKENALLSNNPAPETKTLKGTSLDSEDFLIKSQPKIKLAGKSDSGESQRAIASLNNGCFPASFSGIVSLGAELQDTADILNKTPERADSQEILIAGNNLDPSKDFKSSKEDSATKKILDSAEKRNSKDTVSTSQRELEKKINSEEMYKYSMHELWTILYGKATAQKLGKDRAAADRELTRLSKMLQKQGKSKNEIYSFIGRQLKYQFRGNVNLNMADGTKPWRLAPDGKLNVYSLANNRDQVLAYTAQALIIKNDPVYQKKAKEAAAANDELSSLKKNLTFAGDDSKIKMLEQKVEKLTKELDRRENELLL